MRLSTRDGFLCARGLGVLLLTFQASCAAFSGYPTNYQDTTAVITADEPYLSAGVRAIEDSLTDSARGGLTQQQYRDSVIFRRIEIIDINYYDFESKLNEEYASLDVSADLSALILNGLGATTGSAATKAALAAASAGVIGAKSAINTDVFYQKTLPALIAQMRASRQTALVSIKTGLQSPVSKYSLDEALLDVSNYYIAGTLPSAISQVTVQAGAETNKANASLSALRDNTFIQSYSPRVKLEAAVSKLTAAQALKVYAAMQQYVSTRSSFVQSALKSADPNNIASKDGASAKSLLEMWVSLDPVDTTLNEHWTAAISAATAAN